MEVSSKRGDPATLPPEKNYLAIELNAWERLRAGLDISEKNSPLEKLFFFFLLALQPIVGLYFAAL